MLSDIGRWANENQGILAIVVPVVILFLAGLFRFLFNKFYRRELPQSIYAKGNFQSEGHLIIGNNNTVVLNAIESDQKKQVDEMESQLTQVLEAMEKKKNVDQVQNSKIRIKVDMEQYRQAMAILSAGPSSENKTKLRTFYYSTTDKLTQLQVILALAEWFMPPEDNVEDLIALCDEGISLANEIDAKKEKAALLAYKGGFLSIQFSDLDSETASRNMISNHVGVSLTSKEHNEEIIKKLNKLYETSVDCFKEAERLAKEINSYKALGFVYREIGVAAGHRYIHLQAFGVGMAEDEKQLAKRAFRLSKNIYASANDELEVAYTYYNFANQLRNFGEQEEAISLLEKVKVIALKHNEVMLTQSANILLDRIKTGNVPEYFSS